MPMNFSVIGASGGGGGGPAGTAGTAGCTGAVGTGAGGGGGGAFGLNRNRLRSVSGFGRSVFNASRCTPGGAGAACGARARCAGADVDGALPPERLDAGGGGVDVPEPGQVHQHDDRTRTRPPSTSCRVRSVAAGARRKYVDSSIAARGFVLAALRERHVDDSFRARR